jgi:hypothetical protein
LIVLRVASPFTALPIVSGKSLARELPLNFA